KSSSYLLRSMPGKAPEHELPTPRKRRKRCDATKELQTLQCGWQEDVRIPLSGRKHRADRSIGS
ncbi:MAG: hypothetical protein SGPRY_010919, partial [Prymnesium sp.]